MASDPLSIPPIRDEAGSLSPASEAEVAETLAFALRFDERGRPRSGASPFVAAIAAEWLVQHLRRSGFVVLKDRKAPPHTAG